MWRSILLWTFALAALGAWSAWLERTPADPVRRDDATPTRLQMYSLADLADVDAEGYAEFLLPPVRHDVWLDHDDLSVLDRRLMIHAALPAARGILREACEVARLAHAGGLDEVREVRDPRQVFRPPSEPAALPSVLRMYPLSGGCLHQLMAIEELPEFGPDFEFWFTQLLERSAIRYDEPDPSENGGAYYLSGCLAIRNLPGHQKRMAAFLAMLDRRHAEMFGSRPFEKGPSEGPADPRAYELLPIGHLRPLPDDAVATDEVLIEYWEALSRGFLSDACRAGVICQSDSPAVKLAKKHLADRGFVDGVRRLRRGSTARRVKAFEQALLGNDPQVQSFALWDLELLGPAARQAAPALLTMLRERRLPEDLPPVVHQRLLTSLTELQVPSRDIGQAVRDMSARTPEPDALTSTLLYLIDAPDAEARKAACEIVIERLPHRMATGLRFAPRTFENMLSFETEELYVAMAERAAEFLAGEDPVRQLRACRILVELDDLTPRAMDLLARAVLEPRLAAELRAANEEVAVRALRECLRNSDPDVRLTACRQLQAWNRGYSASDDLDVLLGDPLVKDAAKQALTRFQE